MKNYFDNAKKFLFAIMSFVVLLISTSIWNNCCAQIKGVDSYLTKDEINENKPPPIEQWIEIKSNVFGIWYEHTPLGYKNSVEKVFELLELHDIPRDNISANNNLIPEYAESYLDYSAISRGCRAGDGKIDMFWDTPDTDIYVGLNSDDEYTFVVIGILKQD